MQMSDFDRVGLLVKGLETELGVPPREHCIVRLEEDTPGEIADEGVAQFNATHRGYRAHREAKQIIIDKD